MNILFISLLPVVILLLYIYIKDVDNDGNNEFAFTFGNIDGKDFYTYKYQNGDILEVNLSLEDFYSFDDEDYED